jgi:hypothetical protein
MPLSPPATIGAEIAAAIQAIGVEPGSPVTGAQLTAVWTAVVTKIYADLQGNAGVNPGAFEVIVTSGSSAGTYPVTGTGGPLE